MSEHHSTVDSLITHTPRFNPKCMGYEGVWGIRENHVAPLGHANIRVHLHMKSSSIVPVVTMKLFTRKIVSYFGVLQTLHLDCTSPLTE